MIYAMSDLHGCYDKYKKMLKMIEFSSEDTLYILGDVVDRGPDGIKILLDIANRKNIILLRGNHDDIAQKILSMLYKDGLPADIEKVRELVQAWCSDGGDKTLKQFEQCTDQGKEIALAVLKLTMIYEEIDVQNKHFFLAHTVPSKEILRDMELCKIDDFLWGKPDYDQVYFDDKIIITGHTPTGLIDDTYDGKIYKANNHIAIDCGAVYGRSLGCIRLDDMEEFYVS